MLTCTRGGICVTSSLVVLRKFKNRKLVWQVIRSRAVNYSVRFDFDINGPADLPQVHHSPGQHWWGHTEEGGGDHRGPTGPREGVEAGQVHPPLPRDPAEDPGRPAAPHAVRLPVWAGHHLHWVLRQLLLRGEGQADRYARTGTGLPWVLKLLAG